MAEIRRTLAVVNIGRVLLDEPDTPRWSYELATASGVNRGSVGVILRRMLHHGWVTDFPENQPTVRNRPARRYYRLTERGKAELLSLIGEAVTASKAG